MVKINKKNKKRIQTMKNILNTTNKTYPKNFNQIKLLQDGHDNDVYLLKTNDDEKYILRISKREMDIKSKNDFLFEADILDSLNIPNILVPKVLKTKENKNVININNRFAIIFKYLDGENIVLNVDSKPSLDIVKQAGIILAKLHKSLENFKSEYKNSRNIFVELEKLLQRKTQLKDLFTNADEVLGNCEKYLDWGRNNFKIDGVIHNDFRAQNLLQKDGKISAILDFDWSCYGCFKKDLAQALTEWSMPDKLESYWKDVFDTFLNAYEKESGHKFDKKELLNWICFNCLSDTATYTLGVLDRNSAIKEKKELKSYMYKKFLFFNNF